jgi:ElaB/YqjD/DUF883 family membrane-anchored ribosome-binding protein
MKIKIALFAGFVAFATANAAAQESRFSVDRSGGVDASGGNMDGSLTGYNSSSFSDLATLTAPSLQQLKEQITSLETTVVDNRLFSQQSDQTIQDSANAAMNSAAAASGRANQAITKANQAISIANSAYNRPTSWQSMPAGTQCGIYMMTGSRVRAYTSCQGYNPRNSCPPGYARSDLGYFEAGGGDRRYATCLKR